MSLRSRPRLLWLSLQRRGLLALAALKQRRGPALPPHLLLGVRGELEALFALRREGFHVIDTRWHSPEERGDLDLVAYDGDTLVFVEVKTRSARDLTPARSAVDEHKVRVLQRMAASYRRSNRGLAGPARFDVVSVYVLPGGVECERAPDAIPLRAD